MPDKQDGSKSANFFFFLFYLVCVRTADYLVPAHVWPLVAKRQQTRDAFLASRVLQIDIKACNWQRGNFELDQLNNQEERNGP